MTSSVYHGYKVIYRGYEIKYDEGKFVIFAHGVMQQSLESESAAYKWVDAERRKATIGLPPK